VNKGLLQKHIKCSTPPTQYTTTYYSARTDHNQKFANEHLGSGSQFS